MSQAEIRPENWVGRARTMVGFLKAAAVVVAGVVILACVSIFLFIQVCSGQLSACYRYDMVLATMDGAVQRRINVEGIGFSPGAFVGETLLFNELFEDRYEVRLLDLTSNALQSVLFVEHAPDKLRALERITLAVDGELQTGSPAQIRP